MATTHPLNWTDILAETKAAPWFQQIISTVQGQRLAGETIYPEASDVFNAFKFTPFDQIKVVILGQDPYHGPHQAHGLAFSVKQGVRTPPSLLNIYKELSRDITGFNMPAHGNLEAWAHQGVMLLNTVLTVKAGQANSHADLGWERFTDIVIEAISHHHQSVVFMLWGSHAQKKGAHIQRNKHYVLSAPHPSPLSAHRGFIGCGHFSQCNDYLRTQGLSPIEWQV